MGGVRYGPPELRFSINGTSSSQYFGPKQDGIVVWLVFRHRTKLTHPARLFFNNTDVKRVVHWWFRNQTVSTCLRLRQTVQFQVQIVFFISLHLSSVSPSWRLAARVWPVASQKTVFGFKLGEEGKDLWQLLLQISFFSLDEALKNPSFPPSNFSSTFKFGRHVKTF